MRRVALGLLLAGGLSRPALASNWTQSIRDALLKGCWACDTLNQVSNIGLSVANQAFTALSGEMVTLVGVLMGLWVLFFAARLFLPFGPDGNVGGLWNKAAKKLLMFAVVLGFLQNSDAFWNYVFIPLMSGGIGIAGRIIQMSDPYEAQFGNPETVPAAGDACSAATALPDGSAGAALAVAQSVMRQIDCPLARLQSQFGKGMLVGVAVLFGSPQETITDYPVLGLVDKFFCGAVLIVIYFIGYMLYPLLFIDVVMRTTVITVIAPLVIAASLFVPTRGFAVKAIWHLVQSALTLVFASVVAGIAKATLSYTFLHLPTVTGHQLKDWDTLISALENPALSGVEIDITTSAFYVLVGVGVILLFMLRRARFMAAEFTHVDGSDFSGAQTGVAAIAGTTLYVAGSGAQFIVQKMTGKKNNPKSE